jgi:glycosyltransferase involved in cell wall biosynthesis
LKILQVSPYPVVPLTHGGRVRSFRLGAALARAGARVDLLAPWLPGQPWRPFERDGVVCHPHFFGSNLLPFLLRDRGIPSQVALSLRPLRPGPRRRLRAFDDYDIAQFELCAHAGWMGRAPRGAKVVYSAHNVEHDFLAERPGRTARAALRRISALERRAVGVSDLVVTCTEADRLRLTARYGPPSAAEVIPNGFDDGLLGSQRAQLRERARTDLGLRPDDTVLVFVGGPAPHNRGAVRFLEQELMPRLGDRTVLLLVGQSAGRADHAPTGRVRRLGQVDDLLPPLTAADVGVNPTSFGGGSNIKVADYLGAGLPVVTTRLGSRGFEAQRDWLHVTPLDGFAEALRSGAWRRSGRPPQVQELRWSALGRRLHAAYERLLR